MVNSITRSSEYGSASHGAPIETFQCEPLVAVIQAEPMTTCRPFDQKKGPAALSTGRKEALKKYGCGSMSFRMIELSVLE